MAYCQSCGSTTTQCGRCGGDGKISSAPQGRNMAETMTLRGAQARTVKNDCPHCKREPGKCPTNSG